MTGILGGALVAGLMTFASDNAQASLVISNTVYAPFKLKLSAQYVDGNKLKKVSLTSKEFLKDAGYNGNVQLAVNTDTYTVCVVNKDSLVADLSTNDTLAIEFEDSVTAQPNANKESYKEAGVFYVYSDGFGDMGDYFDISGVYSDTYSWSTPKNGTQTYKENLKANQLSGNGTFYELTDSSLPVTGSASYNGSGKINVD
jgi:hypothetical protein